MKCYHCLNEFTPEDARDENMAPYFVSGMTEVAAAHMECPEELKDTYDFVYYLHNGYEYSEVIEVLTNRGMPKAVAEEIADRRPFYEVKLEVTYDRTNEIFTVNKVSL